VIVEQAWPISVTENLKAFEGTMQNLPRPSPTANRYVENIRSRLLRLNQRELRLVRQLSTSCEWPGVRPVALVLNRLSNGWLYPLVVAGLLWLQPARASVVIAAAALAAGSAHAIYPWIKRRTARPRPCDIDPSLRPLLNTLDRYSFPSGHCMTVTCVLIPVTSAFPQLDAFAAVLWLLVAWARLVTAHHYPSDLIAGTLLGAIVAWPITNLLV
jgi:undecaprenyl-diphosphatase